jgi:glycosyltransferase involved in cell wall biosynthesis
MRQNAPLNIAFDAKRLFLNKAGLGNYSRWLVNGLIKQFPENQYHLYTTNVSDFQKEFTNENCHIHLPPNLFKSFWRSKGVKKDLIKDKIQIYHGLSNELPYGIENSGIKTVVTIHDLIFKLYPEYYNPIDRVIYDKKFRSACERADKIVAISEHTKQCIINFYHIHPDKIEVIYLDASNKFHQKADDKRILEIREKYELNRSYFLNVGAIGGRKNQFKLVQAFSEVVNKIDYDLVLVSKHNKNVELLREKLIKMNLGNRVHLLTQVNEEALVCLYQGSYATVFPSLYEGFGIPILESYRSGKPVITSFGSSLEEICGKAGLLVNPESVDDLSSNLLKITENSIYQPLTACIDKELERFKPVRLFEQYMDLYAKV